MNTSFTNNREQWLLTAAKIINDQLIQPAIDQLNYREQLPPMKYSVSMGEPSNKTLGTCWTKAQSEDNETNHIFITSSCNDSTKVLATLAHELIHAADDCKSGHQNFFAKMARRIGLAGRFTATYASDDLANGLFANIIDALGDIPHKALKAGARTAPPQKARMFKIECPSCAFVFRASRTQLMRVLEPRGNNGTCPCCNEYIRNEVHEALL